MEIRETNLGYLIQTPDITVLLGGRNAQLQNLKDAFPQFQFIRVKQTHSDIVVHSQDLQKDYKIEGDAHYTALRSTALCIATADCLPVVLYDSQTKHIASIHAGWRGVANNIVNKSIQKLQSLGSKPENMQVLIGPHIQMPSFEVGHTVRDEILRSIQFSAETDEGFYHRNLSTEKALVDLNQVVKTQLQKSGISADNLFSLHIDTVTDSRFHSFRRDKEKSGRQLSFIALN